MMMKVMIKIKKYINVVSWCLDGLKKHKRNESTAMMAAKHLHQYLHTRDEEGGEGKEEDKGEESKNNYKEGVRDVRTSTEDLTVAVNSHFLFAVVPMTVELVFIFSSGGLPTEFIALRLHEQSATATFIHMQWGASRIKMLRKTDLNPNFTSPVDEIRS